MKPPRSKLRGVESAIREFVLQAPGYQTRKGKVRYRHKIKRIYRRKADYVLMLMSKEDISTQKQHQHN
jgi:hypothetical protein